MLGIHSLRNLASALMLSLQMTIDMKVHEVPEGIEDTQIKLWKVFYNKVSEPNVDQM